MSTAHIPSPAIKERKVSLSASCKIDNIIRQLFLPMLSMPTPERTSFMAEDAEDQLLRQVAQEKPSVLASETAFVDYMVILYRKFQRDSSCVLDSVRFNIVDTCDSDKAMSISSSVPMECHERCGACEPCGSHGSESRVNGDCSGFSEDCKSRGSTSCSRSRKSDNGRVSGMNRRENNNVSIPLEQSGIKSEVALKIDPDVKSEPKQSRKPGMPVSPKITPIRTNSKSQTKNRAVIRNRVRTKTHPKTTEDISVNPSPLTKHTPSSCDDASQLQSTGEK